MVHSQAILQEAGYCVVILICVAYKSVILSWLLTHGKILQTMRYVRYCYICIFHSIYES
jgi:hypothetical protein